VTALQPPGTYRPAVPRPLARADGLARVNPYPFVHPVPFGVAWVSDFQRVYDPAGLEDLVTPLRVVRVEHARSRAGLWTPCAEAEAAAVDWRGLSRAVALVVAGPR
jgi:hypothetical protein